MGEQVTREEEEEEGGVHLKMQGGAPDGKQLGRIEGGRGCLSKPYSGVRWQLPGGCTFLSWWHIFATRRVEVLCM